MDNILHLVGKQCRTCSLPCTVTSKVVGCALLIKMECNAGLKFSWASSPIITNAKQNTIYWVNLDFSASLLLSGNNFYKIQQFCRFLGVKCLSPTTYFTYQRLCLCPVISEYYSRKMVSKYLLYIRGLYMFLLEPCFARLCQWGCGSVWGWTLWSPWEVCKVLHLHTNGDIQECYIAEWDSWQKGSPK